MVKYDPSSGLTESEWDYIVANTNANVDAAFAANPILANTAPRTPAVAIQKLRDEILAQGTSEKYWSTGSGLSKDEAARMMAEKLVNSGITKLTDFGQRNQEKPVDVVTGQFEVQNIPDEYGGYSGQTKRVFVPGKGEMGYMSTTPRQVEMGDGFSTVYDETFIPLSAEQKAKVKDGQVNIPTGQKEYYSKATGKAIATDYDRAGANDWGGTFAGDSSSGFGVQFKADGTPIFYTHYDTADQLGGLGTVVSVLSIIPSPIQPFAMAANAAIQLEKGNVIGAIASAAGAGGFENVATAANFANAVQNNDLVGMVTAGANLAGVSTSSITQSIGESLGATSLVASKALGGAVLAGAAAAAHGDDAMMAAIAGAAAGAFSGMKDDKILATAGVADVAGGLIAGDIVSDEYGSSKNYDEFMAEAAKRGLVGDPNELGKLADAAAGLSEEYGSSSVYDAFMEEAKNQGLLGEAPKTTTEAPSPTMSVQPVPEAPPLPETVGDYRMEGRNYPTPDSTQGVGGSPVNATMANLPDVSTPYSKPVDYGKVAKIALSGLGAGAVGKAITTPLTSPKVNLKPTGDIYKDAPIEGFRMVKMQNAQGQIKYVPFIKDKAQLPTAGYKVSEGYAKGGFITRR